MDTLNKVARRALFRRAAPIDGALNIPEKSTPSRVFLPRSRLEGHKLLAGNYFMFREIETYWQNPIIGAPQASHISFLNFSRVSGSPYEIPISYGDFTLLGYRRFRAWLMYRFPALVIINGNAGAIDQNVAQGLIGLPAEDRPAFASVSFIGRKLSCLKHNPTSYREERAFKQCGTDFEVHGRSGAWLPFSSCDRNLSPEFWQFLFGILARREPYTKTLTVDAAKSMFEDIGQRYRKPSTQDVLQQLLEPEGTAPGLPANQAPYPSQPYPVAAFDPKRAFH